MLRVQRHSASAAAELGVSLLCSCMSGGNNVYFLCVSPVWPHHPEGAALEGAREGRLLHHLLGHAWGRGGRGSCVGALYAQRSARAGLIDRGSGRPAAARSLPVRVGAGGGEHHVVCTLTKVCQLQAPVLLQQQAVGCVRSNCCLQSQCNQAHTGARSAVAAQAQ